MGGGEDDPGEVEIALAQALDREVGDALGRRQEALAQLAQLLWRLRAEDLGDIGRTAVATARPAVSSVRHRPALEHHPLPHPPAVEELPPCLPWSVALVRVDCEGAAAGAAEAVPDRWRRLEGACQPHPLVVAGPLEGVEEPVVADLDSAVEVLIGAGGEVFGRGLQSDAGSPRLQRLQVWQAAFVPEPFQQAGTGGVELDDGDHAVASACSTVTSAPFSSAERRAASTTANAATPSAAVARRWGYPCWTKWGGSIRDTPTASS